MFMFMTNKKYKNIGPLGITRSYFVREICNTSGEMVVVDDISFDHWYYRPRMKQWVSKIRGDDMVNGKFFVNGTIANYTAL